MDVLNDKWNSYYKKLILLDIKLEIMLYTLVLLIDYIQHY